MSPIVNRDKLKYLSKGKTVSKLLSGKTKSYCVQVCLHQGHDMAEPQQLDVNRLFKPFQHPNTVRYPYYQVTSIACTKNLAYLFLSDTTSHMHGKPRTSMHTRMTKLDPICNSANVM